MKKSVIRAVFLKTADDTIAGKKEYHYITDELEPTALGVYRQYKTVDGIRLKTGPYIMVTHIHTDADPHEQVEGVELKNLDILPIRRPFSAWLSAAGLSKVLDGDTVLYRSKEVMTQETFVEHIKSLSPKDMDFDRSPIATVKWF